MHTHYDNLKVSRTAPPEVIAAAYRTLSKKYHPDAAGADPASARIMAIINKSFSVLSDPERRHKHDLWIEGLERSRAGGGARGAALLRRRMKPFVALVVVAALAFILLDGRREPHASGLPPYHAVIEASPEPAGSDEASAGAQGIAGTPPPSNQPAAYVRPDKAPNGRPWPERAGYVGGYPKLHTGGNPRLSIDNSKNGFDVFLKLVRIEASSTAPIRIIYIPAFQSFTMKSIEPGTYDIRYRDLANGSLARSESFELTQEYTVSRVLYSSPTITLYATPNGNFDASIPLREDEF